MYRYYFIFLIVTASMAVMPLDAVAQTDREIIGLEWTMPRVLSSVRRNPTKDAFLKSMEETYWKSETDGQDGISQQDYELTIQLNAVKQRSSFIRTNWLPFDLDADGVVTRSEIETVALHRAVQGFRATSKTIQLTPEQLAKIQREFSEKILNNYDTDRDRITIHDAIAAANGINNPASTRNMLPSMVPLTLDSDGDDSVSRDEFLAVVAEVFSRFDKNGDDRVSKDEIAASTEYIKGLRVAALKIRAAEAKRDAKLANRELLKSRIGQCNFPEVTSDENLILISTNSARGRALSNVTLDDSGQPTVAVQVKIEPGPEKLVIALTGLRRTIWRFSGSVDRVAKVVIGSGRMLRDVVQDVIPNGVIGVDADKVTFLKNPDCLPYFEESVDDETKLPKWIVEQQTGRSPDRVVTAGRLGTIFVPSLRIDNKAPYDDALTLPVDGIGASLRRMFEEDYPAGIIEVDPASVVTNGKAERLEKLPGNAGLAQLLEEGALKITRYNLRYQVGNTTFTIGGADLQTPPPEGIPEDQVQRIPSEFLIQRKIRLPVGLCDEISPTFILPKDVPLPDLRSCYPPILVEEAGETLCKGDRVPCRN